MELRERPTFYQAVPHQIKPLTTIQALTAEDAEDTEENQKRGKTFGS
jgi:hypothetical protein